MSTTTVNMAKVRTRYNGADTGHKALIGRSAVYTAWDGTRMVGTVEFEDGDHYLRVRFADGRWARLDDLVEVVAA